ncbi:MAG: RHS repeat-associated core domain-containing protein [Bacteroidales bacterium]|nr:RHS repeat-associated core domain-containing protein [Bacteroidales bacterium]
MNQRITHTIFPPPCFLAESFTFSAKEKDSETGYSYFGSRYYSSDLSIWLSVDPMSGKYPSLSPYVYCADNPVRCVDPEGKEFEEGKPPGRISTFLNNLDRKIVGSSENRKGEGHSDGANQVTDDKVVDAVKPVAEAIAISFPLISTINDAKTIIKGKDIYENNATTSDKIVATASILSGGSTEIISKIVKTGEKPILTVTSKTANIVTKGYSVVRTFFGEREKNEKKK